MADSSISGLPAADALAGTETLPLVQGGVTKKATASAITSLVVDAAPGALDTLNELAAALGDDANYATTTTTALAARLVKTSNLSDLANAGTARTNLGLGGGAVLNVGTTGGTLAAGDDSRLTNSRAPNGAAGGALAGTYPNPTLAVAYLPLSGGTLTGALTLTGAAPQIALSNATSSWYQCGVSGFGNPTFNTRSAGTKFVAYPNITASTVDYAMGMDADGALWASTATTGTYFRWYGGTTLAAELTGAGFLRLMTGFSVGSSPALSGLMRIPAGSSISWRNTANSADVALAVNSGDNLTFSNKALITGGLGVGNSAAATVGVGAIARKMEVFDAAGASLGFVPIYASIT